MPTIEDIWNDSLIIDDLPIISEDYGINPSSLKVNCVQKMLEFLHVRKPPSLMRLCCDHISWEPEVKYQCSMKLPSNMLCAGYVAQLQRIKYYNKTPSEKAAQVILYDHVKVNVVVKDYWIKEVNKRCYSISLPKLSATEIENWSGSKKDEEDWRNLDPYSSLEDVGNTTSDEVEAEPCSPINPDQDTSITDIKTWLHERKPIRRLSGRLIRKASKNANYALDEDDGEPACRRNTPNKYVYHQSGPSADRIASQTRKSIPPKQTHPILVTRKKP